MNIKIKHQTIMIGIICIMAIVFVMYHFITKDKGLIVGKGIRIEDINEFYYTDARSTNPPYYQRYHFYQEDNEYYFYYEKRMGNSWPLREDDITSANTVKLSPLKWEEFISYLINGKVYKRYTNNETGNNSPAMYLYSKNDKSKYQVFNFASQDVYESFKRYCETLVLDSNR